MVEGRDIVFFDGWVVMDGTMEDRRLGLGAGMRGLRSPGVVTTGFAGLAAREGDEEEAGERKEADPRLRWHVISIGRAT